MYCPRGIQQRSFICAGCVYNDFVIVPTRNYSKDFAQFNCERIPVKGGYRISLRVLQDFEKGIIFKKGKNGVFFIDRAKAKKIMHIFALRKLSFYKV